jgi:CheY-like chemotaxis protein
MKIPLTDIMLVDDNRDDNFFHTREIKKILPDINIIIKYSAVDALEYFKNALETQNKVPEIIFLDINMPVMSGWEFLNAFERLDKDILNIITIIMLSTFDNQADLEKAKASGHVTDFISKPLIKERLEEILRKYFFFDTEDKRWILK